MNKTFLTSREKFLGYDTTKFGNDVTYSLSERRVALMHTPVPTTIDHMTATVYKQRQNEIQGKESRAESRKLQNDLGKLYGILWDQCGLGMKNKIQLDVEYAEVSKIVNVIGLLAIIERICLSNDTPNYYAL